MAWFCGWLLVLIGMIAGCSEPPTAEPDETAVSPEPVSVVFVDSPGVMELIARQWTAQTGGLIEGRSVSTQDFLNSDSPPVGEDVIIYPNQLLGQLVDQQMIYPLSQEFWHSDSVESRSLLRHSRTTLIRFGRDRWAMSLGNPHWMLLIRLDVMQSLAISPPETWQQLLDLADQLAKSGDLSDADGNALPARVAVPSSRGWAARSWLAIAASTIRNRGKLNSLFDRRDMKPLIDQPPYQQAMQQLQRLTQHSREMSPAEVARAFFSGQLAAAVCWPSQALVGDEFDAEGLVKLQGKVFLSRLPGARQTYHFDRQKWQPAEPDISRVELIGFDGRIASVLKSTRHPTDAFQFLAWLSSKRTVASIFSQAQFGSPTRAGHLGDPLLWAGDVLDQSTADQYADLFLQINADPVFLTFPRIRSSERYGAALEDAIQRFLAGEWDATTALQNAAAAWEKITDEQGRDRQIELLREDQKS